MNEKDWESIPCNRVNVGDYIYFITHDGYRNNAYTGTVVGVDVLGSMPRRMLGKAKAKIMLEDDRKIQSHKVKGNIWRKK